MKKKKTKITALAVLIILIATYIFSSYSPTIAIRKFLLFDNPKQALTCKLEKSSYVDPQYGQQYTVYDYDGVYFAYVDQDPIGLYYWSGGGSGP